MKPLHRRPDWRRKLEAYLAAQRGKPFAWGKHDCCTFCAGAVQAMCGPDLMRGRRGYGSALASRRKMQALGVGSLSEALDAVLPPVAPLLARPGDVALVAPNAIGIVIGAFVQVVGPEGLGRVPLTSAERAWTI